MIRIEIIAFSPNGEKQDPRFVRLPRIPVVGDTVDVTTVGIKYKTYTVHSVRLRCDKTAVLLGSEALCELQEI